MTPVQLYRRLAHLNFAGCKSLEYHSFTEEGDVGKVRDHLLKFGLPADIVVPPLHNRFSPLHLVQYHLPAAKGIKLKVYELRRFALKRMYALLVPDGPLEYKHHDAAIDSQKLIDVLKAILWHIKLPTDITKFDIFKH